jgi:hypothetical protein
MIINGVMTVNLQDTNGFQSDLHLLEPSLMGDDRSDDNKAIFNFVSNYTEAEFALFISILSSVSGKDFYAKLYSLFGKDSLSFSGYSIKVPNIDYLLRLKTHSAIYCYLKEWEFSDDGYEAAAKLFKRKVSNLRAVVVKVESHLVEFKKLFQSPTCSDNILDEEVGFPDNV